MIYYQLYLVAINYPSLWKGGVIGIKYNYVLNYIFFNAKSRKGESGERGRFPSIRTDEPEGYAESSFRFSRLYYWY
jgi:hypothetical protein